MRDAEGERCRELERKLERSERRLADSQRLAQVGSWEWDLIALSSTWSSELLRIFGRDPAGPQPSLEELVAAVHPDDRAGFEGLVETVRSRTGPFQYSYRIVGADGEPRYLQARGEAVGDEGGQPVRAFGTTQDITDLKRSELALERRIEQQAAVASLGRFALSADGAAELREEAERMVSSVLGVDLDEVMDLDEEGASYRVKAGLGRSSDDVHFLQAVGNVLGAAIERERAQQVKAQLEQAQRLESVGQLAGGVAHDFNNLLLVILSYSECLLSENPDEPWISSVREIERAARTAAEVTRQLLQFSRREPSGPIGVDLVAAARDTETLLRRTIGEHIQLTVDLPPGLPAVALGRGQVNQILVNLVVNARDAMPRGGSVTVSAREDSRGPAGSGPAPDGSRNGGPWVILTVADDGVGMREDVVAQAFDPFFTTKPRGQGTGLGLATVYGIVKNAGGSVEIESAPGAGTSVRVLLPVAAATVQFASKPDRDPRAGGGAQTVLVVDNEAAVRTIVCHMLKKHGYCALEAADGAGAEAILDEEGDEVDVLLTDMQMPGISGGELVRRAGNRNPDLSVVYMSGYRSDAAATMGGCDDDAVVLEKPFTAEQLANAVAESLV